MTRISEGMVGFNYPDSDFAIEIDTENEQVVVWNDANGKRYSIEELASFTDDE